MNGGFPSRWKYVDAKLAEFNDSSEMAGIIEGVLSPAHFLHTHFDQPTAVDYLNKYLAFDGLRGSVSGNRCRIQHLGLIPTKVPKLSQNSGWHRGQIPTDRTASWYALSTDSGYGNDSLQNGPFGFDCLMQSCLRVYP
jgi:hypothetical protein